MLNEEWSDEVGGQVFMVPQEELTAYVTLSSGGSGRGRRR
jgi:hypothetical protein